MAESTSLAAKFGRKWGMYVLWLFLVVSVTLEVVARRWEVWVSANLRSDDADISLLANCSLGWVLVVCNSSLRPMSLNVPRIGSGVSP